MRSVNSGVHDRYILDRLMQGGAISGEALSRELGVSRAAIWKDVLKLREAGWRIDAAPRVGYRLVSPEDGLLPMDVYAGLTTQRYGRAAEYHAELDSTNIRARQWAQQGAPDGALVVAERQTAGRGRLMRRWVSPPGAGIYMSLIMKLGVPMQQLARAMPAVPLGVCRGLSEFCDDAVRIKWPNDIVCAGRKLCGMLLEAQAGVDGVDWLIAGIGINAHQRLEDFPEEIQPVAASVDMLTGRRCVRAEVLRAVLREIERCADMFISGHGDALMQEYARASATLGRRVRVLAGDGEFEADALRIAEDGALIVRLDDGGERAVYAGDVSVRGLMGYV